MPYSAVFRFQIPRLPAFHAGHPNNLQKEENAPEYAKDPVIHDWLLLFLYYPVHRFFRDAETETARLRGVTAQCFILVYYMTFMTENALYFCMLTMITSAIAMSYHFEEYMEETKIEYYGT